jgi:hypothetical protein
MVGKPGETQYYSKQDMSKVALPYPAFRHSTLSLLTGCVNCPIRAALPNQRFDLSQLPPVPGIQLGCLGTRHFLSIQYCGVPR